MIHRAQALSAEIDSAFTLCFLEPNKEGSYIHGHLQLRDDYHVLLVGLPVAAVIVAQAAYWSFYATPTLTFDAFQPFPIVVWFIARWVMMHRGASHWTRTLLVVASVV